MSAVIFSSAAVASSAAAGAAADRARTESCKMVIGGFESGTATTGQMQEYASCVNHNYPQPASGAEIIVIKILIASVFVGIAAGLYVAKRGYASALDYLLFGILGALCLPLGLLLLGAAGYGIKYLFS